MLKQKQIPIFDFVTSLSRVMDLMDRRMVSHQLQVAYIAVRLGEEMGLSEERRRELVVAGALHDIGAFHFKERLKLMQFEENSPHAHSEAGYLLLKLFPPFETVSTIVRFHHVPWEDGAGARWKGSPVPAESHLLHLADRVAVAIPSHGAVLGHAATICGKVKERSGSAFVPQAVDAFCDLATKEYFWLEATSDSLESILRRSLPLDSLRLSVDQLVDFAYLLCRVIDFKSPFTATHSSGVAASAVALAEQVGFSGPEQQTMKVAGYLHDLGKLGIPAEIIEKRGQLTNPERMVMQGHVYYTYEILAGMEGFDAINQWGSMHQERMDGSGYPFHYEGDELPLGSRVMAVADVFTALTEDRPYRSGLPKDKTLTILSRMAEDHELDRRIVAMLRDHFDEIDAARAEAQASAMADYEQFQCALREVSD